MFLVSTLLFILFLFFFLLLRNNDKNKLGFYRNYPYHYNEPTHWFIEYPILTTVDGAKVKIKCGDGFTFEKDVGNGFFVGKIGHGNVRALVNKKYLVKKTDLDIF